MTDTTQPPAETLAEATNRVQFEADFQRRYGSDRVSIRRDDADTILAALTRRAGGDAIPAGLYPDNTYTPYGRRSVRHLAKLLGIAKQNPTIVSVINHASDEITFLRILAATPKPPAGGDAGAVERERDEARQIVRDIYWMARRYADGRQSYAAGMFNDAVRKAYDAGWLTHRMNDEPAFARDGMFSGEWKSIEQRARDAEERLAALALPAPVVEGDVEKEARFLCDRLAEFEREITDDDLFTQFNGHVAPSAARLRAALSEGRSHG